VGLSQGERDLLSRIVAGLDNMNPDGSDAGYARLNMPVYLGDQKASDEWWRLMGDQLEASRSDDRKIFDAVVGAPRSDLKRSDARSFLRVVNQARLVYAARLGIAVAQDLEDIGGEDEVVLWFLSFVVDDLSAELSGLLP
jgi:hypothetical protein